jgi:hypothetical protein
MYYWDNSIPPALKEAIQQAGPPILLTDSAIEQQGLRPLDVKRWCQDNLKSFVWMDEQDVTDHSLQWDYIYAFYIGLEKDRNWFNLRWGGTNL